MLRKLALALLASVALAACAVDTDGASSTGDEEGSADDLGDAMTGEQALTAGLLDTEEAAFLGKINAYRTSVGLGKLRVSIALTRASKFHSQEMAANGKLQHESFDGTATFDRVRRWYDYNTYYGENVAMGYTTADDVFAGWKASPGHDANMRGANFTVIGISRVIDAKSTAWWTTDFGGYTDAVLSTGFGTIAANGGFESSAITANVAFGSVRTLSRWHTYAAAGGSTARATAAKATGTYGVRVADKDGGAASATEVVRGAASINYRAVAKSRRVSGSGAQSVVLDFLDGNFARISAVTAKAGVGSTFADTIAEGTSPAGTKYVRVILYGGSAGGSTVDYDDVRLVAW
jgi:uncharacterized protein YkwD